MTQKAANSFILVEKIEMGNKSETGMIMNISSNNNFYKGKIVSIGEKVERLKEGETIYFHKATGMEIPGGLISVKEENVVAIEVEEKE